MQHNNEENQIRKAIELSIKDEESRKKRKIDDEKKEQEHIEEAIEKSMEDERRKKLKQYGEISELVTKQHMEFEKLMENIGWRLESTQDIHNKYLDMMNILKESFDYYNN